MLNDELSKQVLTILKGKIFFEKEEREVIEPWNLYFNKEKMEGVYKEVKKWWLEKGKVYKTIAAISYWGMPLAIILAGLSDTVERVVCLDDEIIPKPDQLLSEEVFLVDDVVKRGTDLGSAPPKLNVLNSSAEMCLAILDNRTFPWREIPKLATEKIEIKVLTNVG